MVQAKVVPATAPLKLMAALDWLLHAALLAIVLTIGKGLTVIVNIFDIPTQPFTEGVTVIVAVIGIVPEFVPVKTGISFEPDKVLNPTAKLVLDQL